MVMAAGLGTRMLPLTQTRPKPLIQVGGRALLDRVLDLFAAAGVERAVVNAHHLHQQIEAHCAKRSQAPHVRVSLELEERLETGGGVVKALPHLGAQFFTTNADSFWVDDDQILDRMARRFEPSKMDFLLLVAKREQSVGLDGHDGDFSMSEPGLLRRRDRASGETVDWNYTGTAITHAAIFDDAPQGAFSLNVLFDRALQMGRLYGLELGGTWITVGTPAELEAAENYLSSAGHI